MTDDLRWAGAGRLLGLMRSGAASSEELTRAAIARIEAGDGAVNAVVARRFEAGLEDARAADAARRRGTGGALLGVPMTVKESFNLAGLPTTWGRRSRGVSCRRRMRRRWPGCAPRGPSSSARRTCR
ncbi:amidase family protein [Roseomonas sp. CCTCC AB2023176]|uniref:amidase family protein n=1 Tax=Roseomonas sp. CCTCC AB2023176 TaxID=3342640 RepID=UPI0035E39319